MKATLRRGMKHRLSYQVPRNKTVPHLYPEGHSPFAIRISALRSS
jgi:hypothetical protein